MTGTYKGAAGSMQEGQGGVHKASPAARAKYLEDIKFSEMTDNLLEPLEEDVDSDDVTYVLGQFDDNVYKAVTDLRKEIGRVEEE